MSATNRGAERREADFYPTPAWCVERLLDRISDDLSGSGLRWLEPCVGDGAIIRAVRQWFGGRRIPWAPVWMTVDLRPEARAAITADYVWMGGPLSERYDVCITNPPYNLALEFVRQAMADAEVVAMLLRLNWLAGEERGAFLREHTPDVYVLPNRPSFTGDGSTDAIDYAWFVWGLTEGGHLEILDSTPIEQRRELAEAAQ